VRLTFDIPDSLVGLSAMSAVDLTLEAKRELALSLHGLGVLSAGKTAELAGMSRMALEALLAERRVERPFSATDFEHESLVGYGDNLSPSG
jgi:predicted HTH domain antitoxin